MATMTVEKALATLTEKEKANLVRLARVLAVMRKTHLRHPSERVALDVAFVEGQWVSFLAAGHSDLLPPVALRLLHTQADAVRLEAEAEELQP